MGDFVMSNKSKLIISLVVLVVVVAFFFSNTLTVPPTEEDTAAAMKANFLAIWNDANYESIPNMFAEDFVMHHSTLPEPLTGIEAYTEFVKGNAVAFSDFEVKFGEFYASGDMTFLFWKAFGTNDGPLPDGTPATGNTFKIWGMAANKIVEGKIVETWIVFNQYDMLRQLGMFGEPEKEKAKIDE
jgi:steroid delta-isomerase-like uncharacterized protein